MKVMLELEEQAQAQACTEMSRSRIVDYAKEGQRSFAFWPIEFPSSSVALAVGGALCTASKHTSDFLSKDAVLGQKRLSVLGYCRYPDTVSECPR